MSRTIQSVRETLGIEKQYGFLGILDAGGNELIRDDPTGMMWVRPVMSIGSIATGVKIQVAPNVYIPEIYNLGVELGYDPPSRQLQITGVDIATMKQQGLDPSIINPAQGKNLLVEQLLNLSCRRHPNANKIWFAYVYPGVAIVSGTVVDFGGDEISLLSEQPSAGNQRYTGVYLANDASLGVSSSTSQSVSSALDVTDLQEVYDGLPADTKLLRTFTLLGSDTDLVETLARTRDFRFA